LRRISAGGLGDVDIYDTNGKLIKQLIAGGADGIHGRIDLTGP
jgi:hypothetical protein